MKQLSVAIALLASTALVAQPNFKNYTKTDRGAYYKIASAHDGRKPVVGDYVRLHLVNSTAKDSVIFSTYEGTIGSVEFQLAEAHDGGDVMHILPLMAKGDSAICYISSDSVYRLHMPPYAKPGQWVKYRIKLLDMWNSEEYQVAKEEARQKLITEQGTQIQELLSQKGITSYGKTASGIIYVMEQPGSGAPPVAGQTVQVHYIGTLMNGTKFDSSRDRNQPFSFVLGRGKVIKGWDEGIPMFRPGGKGTLYIPSPLAYGENGAGTIPANSILIFDIELISVSSEELVLDNDVQKIMDYLQKNNITASKGPSGLFFTVDKPGEGNPAMTGNMVTVHYTGRLLDGTVFDSSVGKAPLNFALGAGHVIKGWDLGLRNFRKGATGRLFIPSSLAYGAKGFPPSIPPNAILIFDIEMVDIQM